MSTVSCFSSHEHNNTYDIETFPFFRNSGDRLCFVYSQVHSLFPAYHFVQFDKSYLSAEMFDILVIFVLLLGSYCLLRKCFLCRAFYLDVF